MSAPLLQCRWTGEEFKPVGRSIKDCDKHFVIGELYAIAEHHQRSPAAHAHYFACLHEAWQNLPDNQAERFPTEEHLRKWCLIRAGFADERTIVASSKAEALRLAAFVRPMDDFAVVTVSEAVVSVYTAKSQSMRAMGRDAFYRSKEAVLTIAAGLIGTEPRQLGRAA